MKVLFIKLKTIFKYFITAVLIGFSVAIFQYGLTSLTSFLYDVFINKVIWKMVVFFILLPLIIFYVYHFTKNNPNISGSGIPALEFNLANRKDKLNWKKDIPMVFYSALMSLFSFCALGLAVGTSVLMGGNIALLSQDVFEENNDDDFVSICMGAGFGCIFLHPLVGIFYSFEETLKKFSFKLLFKTIFIVIVSYFTTKLVFNKPLISFKVEHFFGIDKWYILLIILILSFIVGSIFAFLVDKINMYINLHPNCFYKKYRVIIFFIISVPLAFILGKYLGSGGSLINTISQESIWYIVILILVFRLIMTLFGLSSSLTGGVVTPLLSLGAVLGMAISLFLNQYFSLDLKYSSEIIVLTMLSTYVIVMETPFVGIGILFAILDINTAFRLLIPTVLLLFASRFISRFNGYKDLHDILKKFLK